VILRTDEPLVIRELVSKMIAHAESLRVDWRQRFKDRSDDNPVSYTEIAWEIRRISDYHPAEAFRPVFFRYARGGVVIENLFPPCRFCKRSPYNHFEFQCCFAPTEYSPMTVEEAQRVPIWLWNQAYGGSL